MPQEPPRPFVPVERPRTLSLPPEEDEITQETTERSPWLFVLCLLTLFGAPSIARWILDALP